MKFAALKRRIWHMYTREASWRMVDLLGLCSSWGIGGIRPPGVSLMTPDLTFIPPWPSHSGCVFVYDIHPCILLIHIPPLFVDLFHPGEHTSGDVNATFLVRGVLDGVRLSHVVKRRRRTSAASSSIECIILEPSRGHSSMGCQRSIPVTRVGGSPTGGAAWRILQELRRGESKQ